MRAADVAGLSADSLVKCDSSELQLTARRPRYSALGSHRSTLMPSLGDALARYASLCPDVGVRSAVMR